MKCTLRVGPLVDEKLVREIQHALERQESIPSASGATWNVVACDDAFEVDFLGLAMMRDQVQFHSARKPPHPEFLKLPHLPYCLRSIWIPVSFDLPVLPLFESKTDVVMLASLPRLVDEAKDALDELELRGLLKDHPGREQMMQAWTALQTAARRALDLGAVLHGFY